MQLLESHRFSYHWFSHLMEMPLIYTTSSQKNMFVFSGAKSINCMSGAFYMWKHSKYIASFFSACNLKQYNPEFYLYAALFCIMYRLALPIFHSQKCAMEKVLRNSLGEREVETSFSLFPLSPSVQNLNLGKIPSSFSTHELALSRKQYFHQTYIASLHSSSLYPKPVLLVSSMVMISILDRGGVGVWGGGLNKE